MNSRVTIPNGEETITVELTVKEAIALTGTRFPYHPKVMCDARKKLRRQLENTMLPKQR